MLYPSFVCYIVSPLLIVSFLCIFISFLRAFKTLISFDVGLNDFIHVLVSLNEASKSSDELLSRFKRSLAL